MSQKPTNKLRYSSQNRISVEKSRTLLPGILLVTAVISVASISALAAIMDSSISQSMNIRKIQISEHADEVESIPPESATFAKGDIVTVAYWKKDVVAVSFFPRDLNQSESREVIGHLKDLMRSARTNSSSSNYTGWQHVLTDLSQSTDSIPMLKVIKDGDESADIKVYVEGTPHPENKLGYAWVSRDGDTGEILAVAINIYSSYEVYQEGIIGQLLTHELGHALGLGHASSMESIMHSRIVIVNDKVIGEIRDCESDAINSLYAERLIRDIPC